MSKDKTPPAHYINGSCGEHPFQQFWTFEGCPICNAKSEGRKEVLKEVKKIIEKVPDMCPNCKRVGKFAIIDDRGCYCSKEDGGCGFWTVGSIWQRMKDLKDFIKREFKGGSDE